MYSWGEKGKGRRGGGRGEGSGRIKREREKKDKKKRKKEKDSRGAMKSTFWHVKELDKKRRQWNATAQGNKNNKRSFKNKYSLGNTGYKNGYIALESAT